MKSGPAQAVEPQPSPRRHGWRSAGTRIPADRGGEPLAIKLCWHGCGSFSLRLNGQEFLFDPFFSSPEDYGQWYRANAAAPTPAEYLRGHWPDLCLLTHGDHAHCDLAAIRRLGLMRPHLRFMGADPVAAALQRWCALTEGCVWPTEPGDVHHVGSVRLETLAARHHLEGGSSAESDGLARLAAQSDRFGFLPAPGPAIAFRLTAHDDRVYVGGETQLAGVPSIDATLAVLCIGGPSVHPASGRPLQPALAPGDVAAAVRRLSARAVVAIGWDFAGYTPPLDGQRLQQQLAAQLPAVTILVPPHNQWVEIEL